MIAASHGYRCAEDVKTILGEQDIIISCTHNVAGSTLDLESIMLMKDGVTVLNAGTGTGEVARDVLEPGVHKMHTAAITTTVNHYSDDIVCRLENAGMDKSIRIMCSAHPLTLGCGAGTADQVMDVVFSVALTTMMHTDGRRLSRSIHRVDPDIERYVARICLSTGRDTATPRLLKTKDLVVESRPWGTLSRFASPLSEFSTVRASFEPGANTEGHYHDCSAEMYLAESGTANILVWDPKYNSGSDGNSGSPRKYSIEAGYCLPIPRGWAHCVSAGPVGFTCIVIASPPFSFWDQFFPVAHP